MFKSEMDKKREDIAAEMTVALAGTGISVRGGGRKGPYSVVVDSLSRTTAEEIIGAIRPILARGR